MKKLFCPAPTLVFRRSLFHQLIGLGFQINRECQSATVESGHSWTTFFGQNRYRQRLVAILETLLILIVFALFAGHLPPDVNESHYLTKAKHFWNPNWCPGDLFLSSSFSHWLFYTSCGWLTKFVSLSTFAWIGRIGTWLAIAIAWRRLCRRMFALPLLATLSAVVFLLLNERFHLAGEWVIGGFEAKGIAYFFVLLALGDLVIGRWQWVWPWLGAAAAFHVLVGGWAGLAAGFVLLSSWWSSRNISDSRSHTRHDRIQYAVGRQYVITALIGMCLLAVGAIPPLLSDQNATPDEATAARMIYVNQRIAHHLTFEAFPTSHVARFVLLILGWAGLFRWSMSRYPIHQPKLRRLFLFGTGSLSISLGGLLLSGLAESNEVMRSASAGLLRFYWFRLSDFAIPATTALAVGLLMENWLTTERPWLRKMCAIISIVAISTAAGLLIFEKHSDPRPRADQSALPHYDNNELRTIQTFENWRKACQWIEANTPTDAIFITPWEQQTFKWYAGRTEVVNWKDIPQDAGAIIEWSRRVTELLEPQKRYDVGLLSYSDEQLRTIAQRYAADYLVLPQWQVDLTPIPTQLQQVYPAEGDRKATYVVLKF